MAVLRRRGIATDQRPVPAPCGAARTADRTGDRTDVRTAARRAARHAAGNGALLLVILALDLLTASLLPGVAHAYPFWPSAGVGVALVIAEGPPLLPAVALGSFLFNLTLEHAEPALALVLALGVTLQTALAAGLGRWIAGPCPRLRSTREIVSILLATGPVSCLIGAAVSGFAAIGFGVLTPAQLPKACFTWWAGDVLGVIVLMPATLMLLPGMREAWEGRRLKLLLPSLLLVAMAQVAYGNAVAFDDQRVRAEIQGLGRSAAYSLMNNIDRHGEAIDAVRRLMLSSDAVTAEQFRSFSGDVVRRLPGLHGLSWNPWIRAEERPSFERRQSLDPELGPYRITQRNAAGSLVAADRRPRLLPVAFIEPLEDNQAALGFDILSDPVRAKAIRRAEVTGLMQATDPITLVQEQGDQRGVLMLLPANRANGEPLGFAVGVYRLRDLLASSFRFGEAHSWQGIALELHDPALTGDASVLARYGAAISPVQAWAVEAPVELGGQHWLLKLLPSQQALLSRQTTLPQQLLLACLLVVMFNQAFLLLVTGRDQMERRQGLINHHLASHDALTDLFNRRAFMAALEQARSEVESQLASHVLMVLDLDHFKPVNDTAGHQAGDALLKTLAECLRRELRADDVLARIGGDEFAAILRYCDQDQALQIATKVLAAIETTPLSWGGHRFLVTASLGLRPLDPRRPHLPSCRELMQEADQACYRAKRDGRNTVAIASTAAYQ